MEKILLFYHDDEGQEPVRQWLKSLRRDKLTLRRIDARFDRVLAGNFGDHKAVGEGVSELRFQFGPGFRIYYGEDGDAIVVLLCGGDKSSQDKDIRLAQTYWRTYLKRKETEQ